MFAVCCWNTFSRSVRRFERVRKSATDGAWGPIDELESIAASAESLMDCSL